MTKTGAYSDNFRVSGDITVSNPAPIPAPLAAVYDILRPSLVQPDVTCPEPGVVSPGGVYNCTYTSEELVFGVSRQNDAIAVLQNGTEALGSAPVNFDSVTGNPINNEINVSDSNGLDILQLATRTAGSTPLNSIAATLLAMKTGSPPRHSTTSPSSPKLASRPRPPWR